MSKLNNLRKRLKSHLHAWFIDHEILRSVFRNFYAISENAYRSNHPSPRFIKKLHHRYGIKTIISMRRADESGAYILEKEACDHYGIKLINHPMSSRSLPDKEKVLKAKQLLETVQYPILIHCKSGADRAGLMSVFYELFIQHKSIEESLEQLSMKYGHFRWADTGKLDYFFDEYLAFKSNHPNLTFLDWLENHYDKPSLNQSFKSEGWANIVVNKILRRE